MRLIVRRRLPRALHHTLTVLLCLSLLNVPLAPSKAAAAPPLHQRNFGPSQPLAFFVSAWRKLMGILQPSVPNLDTLRNNTPQQPNAYVPTGSLPSNTYDDPKPMIVANYDGYLTQLALLVNQAGPAGATPVQVPDPTTGTAGVGGLSIEMQAGRYDFTAPVVSLPGRAGNGLSWA